MSKPGPSAAFALPSEGHPSCAACGLCRHTETPFFAGKFVDWRNGKGMPKGPIMIVGDYTTFEDQDSDEHFSSTAGRYLWAKAIAAGVPVKEAYCTYAVRCCPGFRLTSAKPVRYCKPFLVEEIERVRPRAILLVGARALTSVLKKAGLARNRMVRHEYATAAGVKIPVVVTFSPSYVLAEQSEEGKFEQDLRFFADVCGGKQRASKHDSIVVETNPPTKRLHALLEKWTASGATVAVDFETNSVAVSSDAAYRAFVLAASDGESTVAVELDRAGTGSEGARIDFTALPADSPEALRFAFAQNLLGEKRITKVAHNAKFEMHVSKTRLGVPLLGTIHDTLVMHSVLFPVAGGHNLDTVVSSLFNVEQYKSITEEWVGEGLTAAKFADVPLEPLARRCGLDAYWTLRAYRRMSAMLRREPRVGWGSGAATYALLTPMQAYLRVLRPGIRALYAMEARGICFDVKYAKTLSAELGREMDEALVKLRAIPEVVAFEKAAWDAANHVVTEKAGVRYAAIKAKPETTENQRIKKAEQLARWREQTKDRKIAAREEARFNPSSFPQIGELLYGAGYFQADADKLPRTDSGLPSTAKDALTILLEQATGRPYMEEDDSLLAYTEKKAAKVPLVRFILEYWRYQSAKKMKGTFVDGPIVACDPRGYIHSNYHIGRARTGRLASSEINMQNIPNDRRKGKRFRKQFTPMPGYVFIEADYKQIELVILAALSGDKAMCEVYRTGGDIHDSTGRGIFGTPIGTKLTDDQRRKAKVVNFGVIYMESAFGLSKSLRCSEETAAEWIEAYFTRYPGVRAWQNSVMEEVKTTGRVYNLFGTWRSLPNAMIVPQTREEERIVAEALRMAVNAPIQGTAGYCALVALIEARRRFKPRDARAVTTVHDQVLFEVRRELAEEFIPQIVEVMEETPMRYLRPAMRGIEIKVDVKVSDKSWGHMEDLTDDADVAAMFVGEE